MGLFRKGKTCIIARFHRTDLATCTHSGAGNKYRCVAEYIFLIRLDWCAVANCKKLGLLGWKKILYRLVAIVCCIISCILNRIAFLIASFTVCLILTIGPKDSHILESSR